ncbi:ribosome-binding protein 1 isoform X2 [Anolis carolinensis]|uniref:Ribosome receptor lysine/proline rich domain-containing protein n=1 Tax=Anolis carolinensis TaxID=28377 RepID=G1KX17_ANOCA|nr:PREDICTED: ribosome-binding protein 1 [Anolis carolinensis]|eukprot:XP_008107187.1 PREDICTED: ribosome-binding protein 1 [Anolis carolinensis]
MDLFDPQMLGVMVFGGFMVVSAIGIFLVSTFSMKETSYEEALAKQRKELEKASQQKVEKKKKEKPAEKKGKAKKREEKPNGGIPEPDQALDDSDSNKDLSPEPVLVIEPTNIQSPIMPLSSPSQAKEKPIPSPKDKKKKEKKVGKDELTSSQGISSLPATSSEDPILDVAPKEVAASVLPPLGTLPNAPLKKPEVLGSQEERKHDAVSKKKAIAKKKKESKKDAEGPAEEYREGGTGVESKAGSARRSTSEGTTHTESELSLPFKTLISIVSSMVFGDGEAQQLMEVLTEKAGGAQNPWLMATQKSDPVAVLKRQLEEKEKLLTMEQENATAAKAKLRELTKDLTSEKAKTTTLETKWKEQQQTHEQEMSAIQARMQASYQDHQTETQNLQEKIRTLQEQLENGPNTQLARLQQENSILRDALNQATSQTESKQNTELAKLRQECSKLSKELTEKIEILQQVEDQKKALEMKAVDFEEQICQLQISQKEKEAPLQKSLDEISEELCKCQDRYQSLQEELEKAKEEQPNFSEIQSKLLCSETEVKRKAEELNNLEVKLAETTTQNSQLTEKIQSLEALLEANQTREKERSRDAQEGDQKEDSLLQLRFHESSTETSTVEKNIAALTETVEQLKLKNNDLQEKNREATETLNSVRRSCEEKLQSSAKTKETLEQQLGMIEEQTKKVLLSLFPEVLLDGQQTYDIWLENFKEKAVESLEKKVAKAEIDSALASKESNEALSTLQKECDQYRITLGETERMLKDLQKSVEKEEQVWKAKLAASEEALQKSQDQVKYLEDDVEKFKMELENMEKLKEYTSLLEAQLKNHLATANSEHQNYTKEIEFLKQTLSESEKNLEATKSEILQQSQELTQARDLVCSLQSELENLKSAGNVSASANEEVLQLQETLDKEKKLTKDLGCAATRLKELLKITQEQLAKERETVTKLQEQFQEKEENDGTIKEGTSV